MKLKSVKERRLCLWHFFLHNWQWQLHFSMERTHLWHFTSWLLFLFCLFTTAMEMKLSGKPLGSGERFSEPVHVRQASTQQSFIIHHCVLWCTLILRSSTNRNFFSFKLTGTYGQIYFFTSFFFDGFSLLT